MIQDYFLVTPRLKVRRAQVEDATFIHSLWRSPDVMKCVGFPEGLTIAVSDIEKQIEHTATSDFGSLLIAECLETTTPIGQCKIGTPDAQGICEPDIKLDPTHWGKGYGRELWSAMIDHAFQYSDAKIVQGTPNRANTASVRMQRGSGMVMIDEGVFQPNLAFDPSSIAVPYFLFQITREQWQARQDHDQQERSNCE